mmetsp:Transcript_59712/g.176950  ORF Transcript_59712/g.176950 Transcript_59712/m.176950 type:complete len:109 (-) Transcript_59712:1128-1454(-)
MLRRALPACVTLACVGAGSASAVRSQSDWPKAVEELDGFSDELKGVFHHWMETFEKNYKTVDEKIERLTTWLENNGEIIRMKKYDQTSRLYLGGRAEIMLILRSLLAE